ncbi:MAG: hypothetical protein GY710_13220 [Desulfobacteraceae bacterium]|nr:hypothetical protein [Desulfobacteraceae bacterium]
MIIPVSCLDKRWRPEEFDEDIEFFPWSFFEDTLNANGNKILTVEELV